MTSGWRVSSPADRPAKRCLQAFPSFQATRTEHAGPVDAAKAATSAGAPASPAVVEELEQARRGPVNLHEVADNERLLEELDACGVSDWLFRCMPMPYYPLPSPPAWGLTPALSAAPQVGLIASLKNEHKHEIVTQVGALPSGSAACRGAGGSSGTRAALHPLVQCPVLQPPALPDAVQTLTPSIALPLPLLLHITCNLPLLATGAHGAGVHGAPRSLLRRRRLW